MEKNLCITDILSRAVDIVKENAAFLILTPIVYWVACQIVSSFGTNGFVTTYMTSFPQLLNGEMDAESFARMIEGQELAMLVSPMFWISILLSWALAVVYNVGYSRFQLQAIDEKELTMNSFMTTTNVYLNYFLCTLLVGIIVAVGMFLCILPGIYLAVRLWVAPYYVIDREMKCMDAINACWKDMSGNWTKFFIAGLWFILIGIGGFLLCCVGSLFTSPLIAVGTALLYREVSK